MRGSTAARVSAAALLRMRSRSAARIRSGGWAGIATTGSNVQQAGRNPGYKLSATETNSTTLTSL